MPDRLGYLQHAIHSQSSWGCLLGLDAQGSTMRHPASPRKTKQALWQVRAGHTNPPNFVHTPGMVSEGTQQNLREMQASQCSLQGPPQGVAPRESLWFREVASAAPLGAQLWPVLARAIPHSHRDRGELPVTPSGALAVTGIGAGRQENAFHVCEKELLLVKCDGKEPLPTPAVSVFAEELGITPAGARQFKALLHFLSALWFGEQLRVFSP